MTFDEDTIDRMARTIFSGLLEAEMIASPEDEDLEIVRSYVVQALEDAGVMHGEVYAPIGPDDYYDDGQALASAGFGTDEDYGG